MATPRNSFSVDTQPTKEIVVTGLTRDLSVDACVFDLIDNSVDAARNTILSRAIAPAANILAAPTSYEGFSIKLTCDGTGLALEDNCGGIEIDHLKQMVMRFGARSSHSMGIGAFGVGLNRALFKLGKMCRLQTDTGQERAELVLNVESYLKSSDWALPAESFPSSGNPGTLIEIRQPPEDISLYLSGAGDDLRQEIGKRYGRFIAKGLSIVVNKVSATNGEVSLRKNGPFPGEYKFFKTDSGVSVHIEFGQHGLHRFSAETGYSRETNSALTDEYGWTILCNNRAIVLADRSWKTGWTAKFHSEFYGFVGYVNFEGPDPATLPWTTTKTDVDLNNSAYQVALQEMQKFTALWRAFAATAKKAQSKGLPLPPVPGAENEKGSKAPGRSGNRQQPKGAGQKEKPASKPITKEDHNQFQTVLPLNDISELHCNDKHLALVHEAQKLNLADLPYAGLALMRILFEASVATYMVRHGVFDQLKQYSVSTRRANGKTVSAKEEKVLLPNLDEALAFLDQNPEIWGAAKANHLQKSLRKMAQHKPLLNGAIHNTYQTINHTVAFQVRDELLPVLRHLIET